MSAPAGAAPCKPARFETKALPGALASIAPDGSFEGYAALFGRVDLGRDLILPGAFARSLAERGAGACACCSSTTRPSRSGPGRACRRISVGLLVKGRLTLDVARAREVLALMRAGAIDGLSIGFRTVEGRTDPGTRVRRLSRIDLWEVSIVTFPMQPDARIASVKRAGVSLATAIRRGARRLRGAPGLRPVLV
ncbi:HK97 family phage prohead protease [Ancylobacter dichloromethanicus]